VKHFFDPTSLACDKTFNKTTLSYWLEFFRLGSGSRKAASAALASLQSAETSGETKIET
jgi:hypothetical protein